MSAAEWLAAGCLAHLADNPALYPLQVFDFAPERAGLPWAQLEEPVLGALDGAGLTGRIGVLSLTYRDGGERPGRLRTLIGRVEDAMGALPPELGEGWRLAGIGLARSRLARAKDGWLGRSEWAVRVFRVN